MKRRNFLKTCAVGVAAGPISVIMSGEATGKTMHDPFFEYVTVGWSQLVDEAAEMVQRNPDQFGRYTARAQAMQRVMMEHRSYAQETGRMLRITVPATYYDNTDDPRPRDLPMAVQFVADRIDVIHTSGYINTIKDRQSGVSNGIGGRVV